METELSKSIRNRDKNVCVRCNSTDNLHVHHLQPERINHNNSPTNLITLCGSCHRQVENDLNRGVNHNLMIKMLDIAYERSL